MKVKGHLADMVLCLHDQNPRIASLAHLFVDELARKPTNPVYNLLPDLLSSLSQDSEVSPQMFQDIMRELLRHIDKERQADSLLERLTGRFAGVDSVDQWRDVAFCMAQLPPSDKALKKLAENFKLFSHTLVDDQVADCFLQLCSKAKKLAKPDAPTRVSAEALEARIAEKRPQQKTKEQENPESSVKEGTSEEEEGEEPEANEQDENAENQNLNIVEEVMATKARKESFGTRTKSRRGQVIR
mmetsp:Transcript_39307/g.54608  ORF Transcript_39307/g.54608 Transcript_39307/m.54608 type:complete len:243 (+) Transcript_39307:1-729(+)